MPRALLLPLLAASLLLPASAQAQRERGAHTSIASTRGSSARRAVGRLTARSPVTVALAVAERYWAAVPCGGQVKVLAEQPLPAELEAGTDGWVTFDSSLAANDLQAPASSYTHCTITLAKWQWPTTAAMRRGWNMLCLTVTHEVGHLLGHPHSVVPDSVMAPVFTSEANVPAICRATPS